SPRSRSPGPTAGRGDIRWCRPVAHAHGARAAEYAATRGQAPQSGSRGNHRPAAGRGVISPAAAPTEAPQNCEAQASRLPPGPPVPASEPEFAEKLPPIAADLL